MYKFIISVMIMLLLPMTAWSGDDSQATIEVFRYDGSLQCEPASGVKLDVMAKQLTETGVEVVSARQGVDGRMYPMVCGAGTGKINIYQINQNDLDVANELGFMPLPAQP